MTARARWWLSWLPQAVFWIVASLVFHYVTGRMWTFSEVTLYLAVSLVNDIAISIGKVIRKI